MDNIKVIQILKNLIVELNATSEITPADFKSVRQVDVIAPKNSTAPASMMKNSYYREYLFSQLIKEAYFAKNGKYPIQCPTLDSVITMTKNYIDELVELDRCPLNEDDEECDCDECRSER